MSVTLFNASIPCLTYVNIEISPHLDELYHHQKANIFMSFVFSNVQTNQVQNRNSNNKEITSNNTFTANQMRLCC